MLKACIGLNCTRQIDYVDRRRCNLAFIPEDIYRHERTLEELLLDYNSLQELPPKFFRLTNLRKLTLSENDLFRIPPGIANFTRLVELDISKNAIEEIPANIQFCKSLAILDVSSNPLLRTPETVASIPSLTQLCLNDVAIPRLPLDIGNLKNLIILEARENALKTIPSSIGSLKKLRRLDVGSNEIELLPLEVGELVELTELWLDSNCLSELPESISRLSNLTILDVTKNKLERLPADMARLSSLSDFHASENCIEYLPDNIGDMQALTLVKLDFNHLTDIPESIGNLNSVTELLLFDNMLESIPPTLFNMKSLEMLNLDRNHLMQLPATVGRCKSLHVLSLRENELMEVPEDLGQLKQLTVLDLVGNRLSYLPASLADLHLDALWIDGSQPQPLVGLHSEPDPENPDKKRLTCSFLPQQGPYSPSLENFLEGSDTFSEDRSNTASLNRTASFGREKGLGVAFDPSVGPAETDQPSKFVRFPTPFRKDMKAKKKKGMRFKPTALPSTTIFRKGSSNDDLTLLSTTSGSEQLYLPTQEEKEEEEPMEDESGTKHISSVGDFKEIVDRIAQSPSLIPGSERNGMSSPLSKMAGMENLSGVKDSSAGVDLVQGTPTNAEGMRESTPDILKNAVYASDHTELSGTSQLQTIEDAIFELVAHRVRLLDRSITWFYKRRLTEVAVELVKPEGKTLGFSIAGGRGSTPAYEDVDESIFITKIASGGLAEQDGRLRLGDKLLSVNNRNMISATHAEAVAALKSVTDKCSMMVSREVLVVLPEDVLPGSGEEDVVESPTALTTPKTKLTYEAGSAETGSPEPPEQVEGDAQIFAKNIVAQILDRSVIRVQDQMANEVDQKNGELQQEKAPDDQQEMDPHDNYVNYDIAQNVLESTARSRNESLSPTAHAAAGEDEESPLPKISVVPHLPERAERAVSETPSATSLEGYPEEQVVLDRSIGILGLSIVGGVDHASRVFGQGKPGVYVSKITKGGAAHATGKLRLGDRILEVNGHGVRRATHQEAVKWLVSQQGDIELMVQHVPQPAGLQEITIEKLEKEKLGISIRGGAKGSKGNPLDREDEGIFLSKITKGGLAERNGQLHVGHRLLEVNGSPLLGASHLDAVKALRCPPGLITITVCHGYDPREVLRRKERAPVSASASLSLSVENSMHRLSESMDAIHKRSHSAVVPSTFAVSSMFKQSHSSEDLGDKPVTTEDLDQVLKGLAKFRELEGPTQPLPETLEAPLTSSPVSLPPIAPIDATDSLFPLQNGFGIALLGDDLPDIPPFVEDPHRESLEHTRMDRSPSLEAEFSSLQVEDTTSLLAALDVEVSYMQDEVLKQEDELMEAVKEEEGPLTPPPSPVDKSEVETLEVRPEKVKEIKVQVHPPAAKSDPPIDEKAMESIIGEVFDDVSFDEFEEENLPSGNHSGFLTPTIENLRSLSPDPNPPANFQELLIALQGLGEESEEGSQKGQSLLRVEAHQSPVTLRAKGANKDSNRRKSAPPKIAEKPPPPKVAEKPRKVAEKPPPLSVAEEPDREESPETLSFREKLALHKNAADNQGVGVQRPPSRPQSAREQSREVYSPPRDTAMRQTSLDMSISPQDTDPVETFSAMALNEQKRLEKHLMRSMGTAAGRKRHSMGDEKSSEKTPPPSDHDSKQHELHFPSEHKTSSLSPTLLKQSSSQAQHHFEDPSLSDHFSLNAEYETPVDLPSHSNANNNNSTIKSPETASPYVTQILANMPPAVQANCDDGVREGENDEQVRRRAWREEKRAELEQELEKVELLIKEAKASGSSTQP